MILLLILYYLNVKETHGYEIQKFIMLNFNNQWTQIKSGSIYYAINKLEKKGYIVATDISPGGPKAKKVYKITAEGQDVLGKMVEEEFSKNLYSKSSNKFIVFPLLNVLSKDSIVMHIQQHVEETKKELNAIIDMKAKKIQENSRLIESITFKVAEDNLKNEILWHEALLTDLDYCIKESREIEKLIQLIDFSKEDKPINLQG